MRKCCNLACKFLWVQIRQNDCRCTKRACNFHRGGCIYNYGCISGGSQRKFNRLKINSHRRNDHCAWLVCVDSRPRSHKAWLYIWKTCPEIVSGAHTTRDCVWVSAAVACWGQEAVANCMCAALQLRHAAVLKIKLLPLFAFNLYWLPIKNWNGRASNWRWWAVNCLFSAEIIACFLLRHSRLRMAFWLLTRAMCFVTVFISN
jgi:hypothetical protein